MTKQPLTSVTYAELRELLQNERYKGELVILGQSSSGLEAVVKRPEGYHFYTVTDLSISLRHRHIPASTVDTGLLGGFTTTVLGTAQQYTGSSLSFTPETQPWSYLQIARVFCAASSLSSALIRMRLSVSTEDTATLAIGDNATFMRIRRFTNTTARTYDITVQDDGVNFATVDTGRMVILPLYEPGLPL